MSRGVDSSRSTADDEIRMVSAFHGGPIDGTTNDSERLTKGVRLPAEHGEHDYDLTHWTTEGNTVTFHYEYRGLRNA